MDIRGPCPPAGGAHRYFFTLYALDYMPTLAAGAHQIGVNYRHERTISSSASPMGNGIRNKVLTC